MNVASDKDEVIAALLAALEETTDSLEQVASGVGGDAWREELNQARAAIAKAKS